VDPEILAEESGCKASGRWR